MTGKNTDLPATRSAALNQPSGSRFPSENPHHEHNPGVVTATQSTHFDHASHHSDPITQNMDHVIRQDSEEGLYKSNNAQGIDLNRNGIPDAMERNYVQQQSTGQYVAPAQYMSDLNRNGIPDALEGSRSSGEYTTPARYMNDLNRNGIPDTLEANRTYTSGVLPLGSQTLAQPTMQSVEKFDCQVVTKPTIVHEVIKNEETHQVQPVIERTREQTDVYEVVQPMMEREVRPTEVRTTTLPAKHIPIMRETEFVEAQATIPVQIIKTVHVPVSQLTQITTTRMMTASEARSYETTQLPGQFMQKTQLGSTSASAFPLQSTVATQQSQAF